jgi:hypothetical protein
VAYLEELQNPKTPNYLELKARVLSREFPWFYFGDSTCGPEAPGHINLPIYSHTLIQRPNFVPGGCAYPKVASSDYVDLTDLVIREIMEFNNLELNCLFRLNFNCIHRIDSRDSIPHYDHSFPHKNILIYLNNSEGETKVYEEEVPFSFIRKEGAPVLTSLPREDVVISFQGLHSAGQPAVGKRRIALVATYC